MTHLRIEIKQLILCILRIQLHKNQLGRDLPKRNSREIHEVSLLKCHYVYCKLENIWNKTLLSIRNPIQEFTTRHWAKTTTTLNQYGRCPGRGIKPRTSIKNKAHKPSSAILLINLKQLQFIQHRYINYEVTRRHCQRKSRITTVLSR